MRRNDRNITDTDQIIEILDGCKTCRLAMCDGEQPYIVPMTYGYELSNGVLTLYFHSAKEGRKLDLLRKNDRVYFDISREGRLEIGNPSCHSTIFYDSIGGEGTAKIVEDNSEKRHALEVFFACIAKRQVQFSEAEADCVAIIKVTSDKFTCKRH